jgi:hypothetical protein
MSINVITCWTWAKHGKYIDYLFCKLYTNMSELWPPLTRWILCNTLHILIEAKVKKNNIRWNEQWDRDTSLEYHSRLMTITWFSWFPLLSWCVAGAMICNSDGVMAWLCYNYILCSLTVVIFSEHLTDSHEILKILIWILHAFIMIYI